MEVKEGEEEENFQLDKRNFQDESIPNFMNNKYSYNVEWIKTFKYYSNIFAGSFP